MLFQKKRSITVYIIQEDWAKKYDGGSEITLCSTMKKAKRVLRKLVKKESKKGLIHDFKRRSGYVEERTDTSYECYEAGDFTENHYTVHILERELRLAV